MAILLQWSEQVTRAVLQKVKITKRREWASEEREREWEEVVVGKKKRAMKRKAQRGYGRQEIK